MKSQLATIMLAGMFLMSGCRAVDEPEPLPVMQYGTASCDFDDNKWNGVVQPINQDTTDNLPGFVQISKSTTNEFFYFSGFEVKLGKYPIYPDGKATTERFVVSKMFRANPDPNLNNYGSIELADFESYFEITLIDQTAKEIEGKFQVVYASVSPFDFDSTLLVGDTIFIQPDSFEILYPEIPRDTIYLRNGKFKTFLVN
jgi:hypothetical protein